MLGTLSAISGLVSLGTGIWQAIKSNKLSKERPPYEKPKEVDESLKVAQQQAYGTMPGYNQALSNIQQQNASQYGRMLDVASSGTDVLGAIAGQNVATNMALGQLDAANEQYKYNALRNLQSQLLTSAKYSDKETQFNVIDPYMQSQAASAVLGEGAIQNISGGLMGSLSNYMSYKQNQELLDRLFPKTQNNAAGSNYLNYNFDIKPKTSRSSLFSWAYE